MKNSTKFNYDIFGFNDVDYMKLEDVISLLNTIERVEQEGDFSIDKSRLADHFQNRMDEEGGSLPIVLNEEDFK